MNRYLRAVLGAVVGALVGFIVANNVVYGLLGIESGDRTDLLALAVIVAVFAGVGFWWGHGRERTMRRLAWAIFVFAIVLAVATLVFLGS